MTFGLSERYFFRRLEGLLSARGRIAGLDPATITA